MDFSKLMAAATEMRGRLEEQQRQAKHALYHGEAGGGLVRVEMNGNFEVLSLHIDPRACDDDGMAMVEDLVRVAFNQCIGKIQDSMRGQLGSMAASLGLPG